jgi:hypothetical protein
MGLEPTTFCMARSMTRGDKAARYVPRSSAQTTATASRRRPNLTENLTHAPPDALSAVQHVVNDGRFVPSVLGGHLGLVLATHSLIDRVPVT